MLGCCIAYGHLCYFAYFGWQVYFYTSVLCLALKYGCDAEVDVGKRCFRTLSETGTWNNGIFPSIKPAWMLEPLDGRLLPLINERLGLEGERGE